MDIIRSDQPGAEGARAFRARNSGRSERSRASERGVVIIWALLTVFLVAGIIITATEEMRAVDETAEFDFAASGQAEEVAQAGLVEAYAWFRRQKGQPVMGFEPKGLPPSLRDERTHPPAAKLPPGLVKKAAGGAPGKSAEAPGHATPRGKSAEAPGQTTPRGKSAEAPGQTTPRGKSAEAPGRTTPRGKRAEAAGRRAAAPGQVMKLTALSGTVEDELAAADYYSLDTIESETPEVGIVRTFEISPGIWARYTINKGEASEPYDDTNDNGVYDRGEGFVDVNGDGKWTPGNHTRDVSQARGINPKGAVWYITSIGEIFKRVDPDVRLGEGPNVRLARSVWGQELRRLTVTPPASAALCVADASKVEIGDDCRVKGLTAIASATGYPEGALQNVKGGVTGMAELDVSPESVFSLPWSKLMSMADISTSDPAHGLPQRLPDGGLVVVQGDTQFGRGRALRGRGVVAVRGDVVVQRGSGSEFDGLLYVDGDLEIRGPALIRGTVIATGAVTLLGSGNDIVSLEHDGAMVTKMLTTVAQYRSSKAPFRIRDKPDASGTASAPDPDEDPEAREDPDPDPEGDPDPGPDGNPDGEDPCKSDKTSVKSSAKSKKSKKSKKSSGKSEKSSGKSKKSSGKSKKSSGKSKKSSGKSKKSKKRSSPDGEMEPKGGCGEEHEKSAKSSGKSKKSKKSSGKSKKSSGKKSSGKSKKSSAKKSSGKSRKSSAKR